jgi:type II secretory pathway pseudopilin PulG
MLLKLRERLSKGERGFTLLQLLVAMIVIGGVSLVLFQTVLVRGKKDLDTAAKSKAQHLASDLQACYPKAGNYEVCAASLSHIAAVDSDLSGALIDEGEVAVLTSTVNTFTVVANSRSENYFVIGKDPTGRVIRSCGPTMTPYGIATGRESGGCGHGNTW